jgi:hypothetical protein
MLSFTVKYRGNVGTFLYFSSDDGSLPGYYIHCWENDSMRFANTDIEPDPADAWDNFCAQVDEYIDSLT